MRYGISCRRFEGSWRLCTSLSMVRESLLPSRHARMSWIVLRQTGRAGCQARLGWRLRRDPFAARTPSTPDLTDKPRARMCMVTKRATGRRDAESWLMRSRGAVAARARRGAPRGACVFTAGAAAEPWLCGTGAIARAGGAVVRGLCWARPEPQAPATACLVCRTPARMAHTSPACWLVQRQPGLPWRRLGTGGAWVPQAQR